MSRRKVTADTVLRVLRELPETRDDDHLEVSHIAEALGVRSPADLDRIETVLAKLVASGDADEHVHLMTLTDRVGMLRPDEYTEYMTYTIVRWEPLIELAKEALAFAAKGKRRRGAS